MSTIYDYVQRVRNQIRDNGTVQAFPDATDYTLATPAIVANNSPELTQFVNDALAEYSRYRPLKKPYTLNIVAGQAQYSLPSDWMAMDFTSISAPLEITWYDDSQIAVISNKPQANYTLNFNYYAYHQATTTTATIPRQWEYIAMLPACECALRAIATDQSVKLQKYKIAGNLGFEVDNHTIAEHLMKLADDYREEYRKQVILRPYGTMGGDHDVTW